jgi:hypothetical protein
VTDKCQGKNAGPQVNVNLHGHHIVMKGKFNKLLAPVQNILCKHCIDPYIGCDNLVIAKNFCHTENYAKRTVQLITDADNTGGKDEVIAALKVLTDEFVRCNFAGDTPQEVMKMVSDSTDE